MASRIQVLTPCGGWRRVLESLDRDHLADLRRYSERRVVLVIDFDGDESRLGWALSQIPGDVRDRVFIIGARTEPEDLKRSLRQAMPDCGSYEKIGSALADDCRADTRAVWDQPDLACNRFELDRMAATVRPCLFGTGAVMRVCFLGPAPTTGSQR